MPKDYRESVGSGGIPQCLSAEPASSMERSTVSDKGFSLDCSDANIVPKFYPRSHSGTVGIGRFGPCLLLGDPLMSFDHYDSFWRHNGAALCIGGHQFAQYFAS
jgi:hypothetical protein